MGSLFFMVLLLAKRLIVLVWFSLVFHLSFFTCNIVFNYYLLYDFMTHGLNDHIYPFTLIINFNLIVISLLFKL